MSNQPAGNAVHNWRRTLHINLILWDVSADLGGSAKLSVLAGIGHESWDVVKSDPDAYLKWMFRIRQVHH